MGCDYYARVIIGIPVDESSLMTTTTKTVVVCGHPEAEGTRFCPVCGVRDKERTKTVTVKNWKPEVQPHLADYKDFQELLYDDGVGINGLFLCSVASSSMDRSPRYVLGKSIANVSGESGWGSSPNPSAMDATLLGDKVNEIRERARGVGLIGDIQIYTLCYASV